MSLSHMCNVLIGCINNASFGFERATRCAVHKLPGMRNIATSRGGAPHRSGTNYEKLCFDVLKTFEPKGVKVSLGGGASHTPDLRLEYKGKSVNIEVKTSPQADFGQRSMTLVGETTDGYGVLKFRAVPECSVHIRELKDFQPFGGLVPPFMERRISVDEWRRVKADFKDEFVPLSPTAISRYYSEVANCSYVQIKNFGLYHTGEDPLELGVPALLCPRATMRIRCKQHGSTSLPSSVTAAFKSGITSKYPKSPVSIDDCTTTPWRFVRTPLRMLHSQIREVLPRPLTKRLSVRSPLRYPGGKTRAIKTLDEILFREYPDTKVLISPFFGGGSFELHCLKKVDRVEANDLFAPLIAFWSCLQKDTTLLMKEVQKLHPLSKETFHALRRDILTETDPVKVAAYYFAINRSSFSGATFCGGYSAQAAESRFNQSSIDRLGKVDLSRVTFDSCDFVTFLRKHPDCDGSTVYLDPPYYISSYLYGRDGDMHSTFDHEGLKRVLTKRRRWVLSYNDCSEIRALYHDCEILEVNWAYGMNKSRKSNEILILPRKHRQAPSKK